MDRIAELVRQLEPDSAQPSAEARARQRYALLQSMAQGDRAPAGPPGLRPRRARWFAILAGAAAAAAALAFVLSGPTRSGRTLRVSAKTSAVLAAVKVALAGSADDLEKVQSTLPDGTLSATSWVDLATGACRVDTAMDGHTTLTVFDERGRAVVIDYTKKEWWSRGASGVTCEPITPRTIEHSLAVGGYALSGRATIDGQPSLKLVATTTSSGLHPMTKLSTMWVNAMTYLPIQSTSTGHLTERTIFTWLPSTVSARTVLEISVPPGFQEVAAPPAHLQPLP